MFDDIIIDILMFDDNNRKIDVLLIQVFDDSIVMIDNSKFYESRRISDVCVSDEHD